MSEAEGNRYANMAVSALAVSLQIDPSDIKIGTITSERIPNPPRPPGTMGINPIRYRYIIYLERGNDVYRYRAEQGAVHFEAQA